MKFVATKKETNKKQQAALERLERLERKAVVQNAKILKAIIKNIEQLNKQGAEITLKITSYTGMSFYSFSNVFRCNKDIPVLYFSCFDDNNRQLKQTLSETTVSLKNLKSQIKFQKRLNALKNL